MDAKAELIQIIENADEEELQRIARKLKEFLILEEDEETLSLLLRH